MPRCRISSSVFEHAIGNAQGPGGGRRQRHRWRAIPHDRPNVERPMRWSSRCLQVSRNHSGSCCIYLRWDGGSDAGIGRKNIGVWRPSAWSWRNELPTYKSAQFSSLCARGGLNKPNWLSGLWNGLCGIGQFQAAIGERLRPCTTRTAAKTSWLMPMLSAAPTRVHRAWTV
jgi:hypothetical protein